MLAQVDDCGEGGVTLGQLVDNLRGLFGEADPHDMELRSDFESYWSPICGEYELRTESWARKDQVSDERLAAVLSEFQAWVRQVLDSTSSEHD